MKKVLFVGVLLGSSLSLSSKGSAVGLRELAEWLWDLKAPQTMLTHLQKITGATQESMDEFAPQFTQMTDSEQTQTIEVCRKYISQLATKNFLVHCSKWPTPREKIEECPQEKANVWNHLRTLSPLRPENLENVCQTFLEFKGRYPLDPTLYWRWQNTPHPVPHGNFYPLLKKLVSLSPEARKGISTNLKQLENFGGWRSASQDMEFLLAMSDKTLELLGKMIPQKCKKLANIFHFILNHAESSEEKSCVSRIFFEIFAEISEDTWEKTTPRFTSLLKTPNMLKKMRQANSEALINAMRDFIALAHIPTSDEERMRLFEVFYIGPDEHARERRQLILTTLEENPNLSVTDMENLKVFGVVNPQAVRGNPGAFLGDVHAPERESATSKALQKFLDETSEISSDQEALFIEEIKNFLETYAQENPQEADTVESAKTALGLPGAREGVGYGALLGNPVTFFGQEITGDQLLARVWTFTKTFEDSEAKGDQESIERERKHAQFSLMKALSESVSGGHHRLCSQGIARHL